MIDKKNTPEIRFKGHTERWVKNELSKIVDVRSGRDYKHLSQGDIPVYGTGGYMLSVNEALSYNEDAIGIGRKGTIDKPFILEAPFWTVDTLFYAVPKESHNLHFIYDVFQKINWKQKDESTGVPSLSKTAINSTQVLLPNNNSNEQFQIGKLFTQVDHLINFNQKKYNKLVTIKKAMLQKMFPRDGAFVPEIRFDGFTKDWEEIVLGEVGEFKSNGVDKTISSKDTPVNMLNYMDVFNFRRLNSKNCHKLMQVTATNSQLTDNNVLENDIFFTPSSETVEDIGKVMVIEETLPNTVYSYHLMRFRPKEDVFYSAFPNYAFASGFVRKQLIFSAQGVQRFVINKPYFEEITVLKPSIEEQTKIAEFFKQLDNRIFLKEKKIEKLKNIKKALLEKMLV